MRFPHGTVWFGTLALIAFASLAPAEEPVASRAYKVADLSFTLPFNWRTQTAPESPLPGIIFVADGGQSGRMTVARLSAAAASIKPLDAKLDPMSAQETVDLRIALEEAGLTPSSGEISSTIEGNASVEAVAFRCKPPTGSDVVVLTATWRSPGQALRARLQFSEGNSAELGSVLSAIRSSIRFRNTATHGFGNFRVTPGSPSNGQAKLAGVQAADSSPASVPAGSQPAVVIPDGKIAQLVQDYRGSLVFIEGGGGAGSGFVCQMKEGVYLLTNQHVLAGMNVPRFTRLDSTPIAAGAGSAAVGHDLMRFGTQGEARPLMAMSTVEAEAQIGDEIVVLGNMEGARVIQPLPGKLIGIGPDRVEVTAEFLPGNSGSPIIHVKTGKVLGIATYLLQRKYSELTDSKDARVRRFGFRLDSVKQWQALNWQTFQQDKGTVDRVESTTRDLIQLIRDMRGNQGPKPAAYRNSSVVRAVRDLETTLSRQGLSTPDRTRAFQNFLAVIRAAAMADINQARQTVRYDYFTQQLRDEAQVREEIHQLFDRLIKAR